MLDFNKIKAAIKEEEQAANVYIVEDSEHFIEIVDDINFARPTLFTDTKIMDESWFKERIWVHPHVTDFCLEAAIAMFPFLNKDLLINLRNVIVVNNIDEVEDYINAVFDDYDVCEFMDMYPETTEEGVLGLFWYYAGCPIIFMDSIRDQLSAEGAGDDTRENLFAILGTLAHEIYHLGAENPFNEDLYQDTEDNAENYGRACTDNFIYSAAGRKFY